MLKPRWRKVLADLWNNKARTLLVVASIAVGVFAIGVIAGTYIIISEDINASYQAVNPVNVTLASDPFQPDFVDTIRHMDEVAEAEGRRIATVRVRIDAETWDTLSLVAAGDAGPVQINQHLPRQGHSVPDDQEVVLERKTMESLGVTVGDELEIELADGTTRYLRVVGSAQEPTIGYGGILGDLKGFITYDTLEWLHYPLSLNRLLVTVAEAPNDEAHVQAVAAAVTERVEASGRQIYQTATALQNEHPISSIIEALLGVLTVLGILVVFLSGSLISNTMSALLNQHLRQIGVMKLVGARPGQVVSMYMTLIATFGLIALVIAVPLGGWGAFALSRFAADIVNFVVRDQPMVPLVPLAVVFQVVIALVVPLGAGLLPVLRGARITVHRALASDDLANRGTEKGWIDRRLEQIRRVSRPLLISLRNTFRRKGRLALTLFTLTLGGAIFIAVFNARASLDLQVLESTKYFQADVNLDFARPYRIEEVRRHALAIPGVESIEAWTYTSGEFGGDDERAAESFTVIAPPAGSSLIDPTLLEGRWLTPEDEHAVVLNEAFWTDHPQLQAGDTLELEIAGQEDDWTAVGIFQYTGMDALFAYVNRDYLARELNQLHHAATFRITTTDHSLGAQKEIGTQLEQHFTDLGFRVSQVESGSSRAASISDVLGILIVILLVMALLTALVGSIGLTGTMSMNVLERTREIGVLRAIGAHDQVVVRLVIIEGLLIGGISFLLGMLLSFPITTLLSNVISMAIFNAPATVAFTIQGFAIWLVVVVILSVLASLLPARNASRLTIREVLAYE